MGAGVMGMSAVGVSLAGLRGAAFAGLILSLLATRPARADDMMDSGRLLATGGVATVEGAAGGGLSTWAVIAGYGTRDSIGGAVHYTAVPLPDFTLHTAGAAIGLFDRVELSYAHQWFDTGDTGAKLGLGKGFTFHQHIGGVKVKLLGNVVYDQDTWLPQIAAGVQFKSVDEGAIVHAVGAKSAHGTEPYLAATKLILDYSLLLNATIRGTRANQLGLLGFGGDRDSGMSVQTELSAAYLINRNLAVGADFRTKPDNLKFAHEDNAFDLFVAWFPVKTVSLTLAYADLGQIATFQGQRGPYVSVQVGF